MHITNPPGMSPQEFVDAYYNPHAADELASMETVEEAQQWMEDNRSVYEMYMDVMQIVAGEYNAKALLGMRDVNEINEKLDLYNSILSTLQSYTGKDVDIDMNAIKCPPPNQDQSLASWFQENEPEIYAAVSKGSSFFDETKLDALITSFQSKIETISTNVQTIMIQVQDNMAKSDDYMAGAKKAIDWWESVAGAINSGIR